MPREKSFLYRDWVEAFRREVEEDLERLRKAPLRAPSPEFGHPQSATPDAPARPAREAVAGLRAWWERSWEDPTAPREPLMSVRISRELELSRKEVAALRAELDRLRSQLAAPQSALVQQLRAMAEAKARLEDDLGRARLDRASLKDVQALKEDLDAELGRLRERLAALRAEYEGRLRSQLERIEDLQRRAAALEAEGRERRLAAQALMAENCERLAEAQTLREQVRQLRGDEREASP